MRVDPRTAAELRGDIPTCPECGSTMAIWNGHLYCPRCTDVDIEGVPA
jgi:ribosomal protein S27AE